ncbi:MULTISPECIES: BREX-2 system phosphatase PglZ [unclassified Saccharopolyspora]|uniref:BREX-2 system phosphatase PglZ n=1 Tax=unclassified Saccharopolyspora TaxID=2646250 RepID=UPI001CD6CD17|nr:MULTISPECIES: BREX-2 system phosphatase PglZ [unclassified Saccharopolyspora]MCA1186176.1 BREX-2 system phosphatase PglZ [Saccharopolyspora sp. 6T]MCA1278379.1 BREX-2 system phosphatase PglZ [Saccharopolyspora sp. 7B]
MTAPPTVDRRVIEALVKEQLQHAKGRRLLLVYARYDDLVTTFVLTDERRRRVHVDDQHSVLGMTEAWRRHLDEHAADDDVLVLTTSVPDDQLGWDLRAYAVKRSVRDVDRARIVAQRFGAKGVDARVRSEEWLVDGLLETEPVEGWPRAGSVLTRDHGIRALIGARLGLSLDGGIDPGSLLEWSRTSSASRFAGLAAAERDGIAAWLTDTVGSAATVLLRLVDQGRAADAMPLGVVAAVATGPNPPVEAGLALGGLLGGVHGPQLRAFTEAVRGTLERWMGQIEHPRHGDAARRRVLEIAERADELAASAGLTEALRDDTFVPSAFTARLRALGTAVSGPGAAIVEAERALNAVGDHVVARLRPDRVRAAEMAVRLLRWSREPDVDTKSVAADITRYVTDTAWVDRGLQALWHGDPSGDLVVGQAYRALWQEVRQRRDRLDEGFAQRLAAWAPHASTVGSDGVLLIEQVLPEIAAPVARRAAPLIVVLDGMSAAVAARFGEELTEWTEVSPEPRRVAAVAAIPSVTQISRASLLSATVTDGGQDAEKTGFEKFWRGRKRTDVLLFHKAEIAGGAGTWLSHELYEALSVPERVVGVVLNTIDDALDDGKEGDRAEWRVDDVTYLRVLLDSARSYQRPVVLVSDHGHVLDRGGPQTQASGIESARWRRGTPGDGEVALAGPRVVPGALVAPWREDIRYTRRKAGYHGGASLAEMTVPVLVLVPSLEYLPDQWHVVPRECSEPAWWSGRTVHAEPERTPVAAPAIAPAKKAAKNKPAPGPDLFTVDDPAAEVAVAPAPLGERVVAGDVYERQRVLVPRAPERKSVAAVIDALVAADGRASTTAVVAVAGRAARRPEGFVRMIERLLNVDGYPIVSIEDGGTTVRLDVALLRVQFGVES